MYPPSTAPEVVNTAPVTPRSAHHTVDIFLPIQAVALPEVVRGKGDGSCIGCWLSNSMLHRFKALAMTLAQVEHKWCLRAVRMVEGFQDGDESWK